MFVTFLRLNGFMYNMRQGITQGLLYLARNRHPPHLSDATFCPRAAKLQNAKDLFLTMTKHDFFFQKASFPPVASSGQHLRLRPAHHLPALATAVLSVPISLCFIQRPLRYRRIECQVSRYVSFSLGIISAPTRGGTNPTP